MAFFTVHGVVLSTVRSVDMNHAAEVISFDSFLFVFGFARRQQYARYFMACDECRLIIRIVCLFSMPDFLVYWS